MMMDGRVISYDILSLVPWFYQQKCIWHGLSRSNMWIIWYMFVFVEEIGLDLDPRDRCHLLRSRGHDYQNPRKVHPWWLSCLISHEFNGSLLILSWSLIAQKFKNAHKKAAYAHIYVCTTYHSLRFVLWISVYHSLYFVSREREIYWYCSSLAILSLLCFERHWLLEGLRAYLLWAEHIALD
jgi:hypothetical protein